MGYNVHDVFFKNYSIICNKTKKRENLIFGDDLKF